MWSSHIVVVGQSKQRLDYYHGNQDKITVEIFNDVETTTMNILSKQYVCSNCAFALWKGIASKTLSRNPIAAAQYRRYSQQAVTQDGRPFRMAVIGSGPAGFYTAYKVMSKIDNAVVDMYEQLPVPYGLVRFGVAPDHPEVKVIFFLPLFLFISTMTQN